MALDVSTFADLKPTEDQLKNLHVLRLEFANFAKALSDALPDGPDKTYVLRLVRTAAMWANVAVTRQPDGAPRG